MGRAWREHGQAVISGGDVAATVAPGEGHSGPAGSGAGSFVQRPAAHRLLIVPRTASRMSLTGRTQQASTRPQRSPSSLTWARLITRVV